MAFAKCMRGGFGGAVRFRGARLGCKCTGADLVMSQIDEIGEGLKQLSFSRANVQDQVDRLTIRLQLLSDGVQNSVMSGASVPAQLLAALNALQRDQTSLANIVQLAGATCLATAADNLALDNPATDSSAEDAINSLVWESSLEDDPEDAPPCYTMTAELSSSASSSIREEIERRVLQQLAEKSTSVLADPFTDKGPQLPPSKARHKQVPLEVHEAAVKELRESLLESRLTALENKRVYQEKEAALSSALRVQQAKLVEQEAGVAKNEEMESAISAVVANYSVELAESKERIDCLCAELEAKEAMILQLKERWGAETKSLNMKLSDSNKDLMNLREMQNCEREKLLKAEHTIRQLNEQLSAVQQNYLEAEAEAKRKKQQEDALSKMSILITEMSKATPARSETEAQVARLLLEMANLRKEKNALAANETSSSVFGALVTISAEKMRTLEKFFAVTRELLDKQTEYLDKSSDGGRQVTLVPSPKA